MDLTRFGVWTSYRAIGSENAERAARLAQDLGFGAFWLGGSPDAADLRPLLQATDGLIAATGIVNVWSSPPDAVAAQAGELDAEFPGRSLIGIGIGHPEATSDYTRPLRTMRTYLDALDGAPRPLPADERVIAALGPKMLDLAGERTLGTHPYFVSVEHTQFARERLGDGPLIATELACVVDGDVDRARAAARRYAKLYLGLGNYTTNLKRFGFTDADIADGGSDRLIDTIVPHGSPEQIATVARAHLDAGADHVCLQAIGEPGVPAASWTALAYALGLSRGA